MHFIKYFVIFALFAIQLSVQKSKSTKEISLNESGDELTENSVEELNEKTKKPSKVKKVLGNAKNFFSGVLKTGVSAAGKGLLGNVLEGSSKSKKSKSGNGILGNLFGSKKDSSDSDESSEEKTKSKKKSRSKNRSDSNENETSSKKKSSGSIVKSFKSKVVGGVKNGLQKQLTKSLFGKLF